MHKRIINEIIREVHEGECGTHLGRRNSTNRIIMQGYYFQAMLNDCTMHTKKCEWLEAK